MWIIGDVHGKFNHYKNVVEGKTNIILDETIQIGDMGVFTKGCLKKLKNIDCKHRWFRGNHDNPNLCKKDSNYLGDWGYSIKSKVFWLAGGLSIDQCYRKRNFDWWEKEQLSSIKLDAAKKLFISNKPDIMLSHECPIDIIGAVSDPDFSSLSLKYGPSRTSIALQSMLDKHQPKLWIFGHYHIRKSFKYKNYNTQFECLDEFVKHSLHGNFQDCLYEIPGVSLL